MGDWTITITGHGIHDNDRPEDADAMAVKFAGELRAAGHEVHSCTFLLDQGDGNALGRSLLDDAGGGLGYVYYPGGLDDPRPYPAERERGNDRSDRT